VNDPARLDHSITPSCDLGNAIIGCKAAEHSFRTEGLVLPENTIKGHLSESTTLPLHEDVAQYAIISYIIHVWIHGTLNLGCNDLSAPVRRGAHRSAPDRQDFHPAAAISEVWVCLLDLPTEADKQKGTTKLPWSPPSPVIIDEVQYAPRLFRHLKVVVDASRARNGQFLLTGSQKFTLMKSVSESLAGGRYYGTRNALFCRDSLRTAATTIERPLFGAVFPNCMRTRTLTMLPSITPILPPIWK